MWGRRVVLDIYWHHFSILGVSAENHLNGGGEEYKAAKTGSDAADGRQKPASSGAALLRLARKQRSPKSASPPGSKRQGSSCLAPTCMHVTLQNSTTLNNAQQQELSCSLTHHVYISGTRQPITTGIVPAGCLRQGLLRQHQQQQDRLTSIRAGPCTEPRVWTARQQLSMAQMPQERLVWGRGLLIMGRAACPHQNLGQV